MPIHHAVLALLDEKRVLRLRAARAVPAARRPPVGRPQHRPPLPGARAARPRRPRHKARGRTGKAPGQGRLPHQPRRARRSSTNGSRPRSSAPAATATTSSSSSPPPHASDAPKLKACPAHAAGGLPRRAVAALAQLRSQHRDDALDLAPDRSCHPAHRGESEGPRARRGISRSARSTPRRSERPAHSDRSPPRRKLSVSPGG